MCRTFVRFVMPDFHPAPSAQAIKQCIKHIAPAVFDVKQPE